MFFFIKTELKAKDPLLDIRAMARNSCYLRTNLSAMLCYGSVFAMNYLLSVYLQSVAGIGSGKAGCHTCNTICAHGGSFASVGKAFGQISRPSDDFDRDGNVCRRDDNAYVSERRQRTCGGDGASCHMRDRFGAVHVT